MVHKCGHVGAQIWPCWCTNLGRVGAQTLAELVHKPRPSWCTNVAAFLHIPRPSWCTNAAAFLHIPRPSWCTKLGRVGAQMQPFLHQPWLSSCTNAAAFLHIPQLSWCTIPGCVFAQTSADLVHKCGCIFAQTSAEFAHKCVQMWPCFCTNLLAQKAATFLHKKHPPSCTKNRLDL